MSGLVDAPAESPVATVRLMSRRRRFRWRFYFHPPAALVRPRHCAALRVVDPNVGSQPTRANLRRDAPARFTARRNGRLAGLLFGRATLQASLRELFRRQAGDGFLRTAGNMKMPTFDTAPDMDKVYSGYGKALLEKWGWREGEGVGKNKQGMSEALKVKKRDGEIGLGAEDSLRYKWEEKWWEGHFKSAADKFAEAVKHVDSESNSDSDSDSDSDSEMARQLASCAVDHNGNAVMETGKVKGRDGIYYSGKKSDFDLAQDLAKDSWGNWGRAKGKLARIAKMEEEQLAKYGIQAGEATNTSSDDDSGDTKKEAKAADKKKAAAAPSTPSPEPEPQLTGEAWEGLPSKSTKEAKWWVNAKFVWGGLCGSAREKSSDVRKNSHKIGFTEDDQEALFNSAHAGKVEKGAKRGLGGKGQIKSEHTGTKMRYDDEGNLISGGVKHAEGKVGDKEEKKEKTGKSKDKEKEKSKRDKKDKEKDKDGLKAKVKCEKKRKADEVAANDGKKEKKVKKEKKEKRSKK